MDLKLGKRVWDDNASQDKIEREKKKYPIQDTVGIRIIGMRVSLY
jgi:1D-myo-inositol-tetrakisphosphate 5-kinase/inositol-polyphosphate multikinase